MTFQAQTVLIILVVLASAHPAVAIKIECSYPEPDFFWATFDRAYTCDGVIELNGDDEFVTTLGNNHRRHMTNSNVHGLVIVHQRDLERFPRGIERYFHNLKGIDLEGCGLTRISSEDLQPFKNLLQLSLDENRLSELPHDLFQYNMKLKRIDIEGNLLLHVGLDIFNQLPELTVVYMKHNSCTSESSFALRRDELKDLAWELTVECPPTLAMLSKSLFASESFVENVRKISLENSEGVRMELLMEIHKIERKIQEMRRKL